MVVRILHPKELGPSQILRWRTLQASAPALRNPYFAPEFAMAVGAARHNARIAFVQDGEGREAVFSVQRPSALAAMALGSPIADYQGLVGPTDFAIDNAKLCAAFGVGRIDFGFVPEEQTLFASAAQGWSTTWVAEVGRGKAAYLLALREKRGETVRQQDKKRRKLAREKGDPAFVALSRDKSHLDTLVDWKHAQCLRTTQPGVWDTRWVRETLDWLWEHNAPDCRPALFTLVGEEGLIAAAFCLASPWVLHVWLIGYDEAYGAYSPGVLLSRFLCEWAADNGFSEVDFGAGDYRYKRELTTTTRQLAWGFLARPSLAGAVRAAECAARAYAEKHPNWGRWSELPGKAMRRLDAERGLGLFFR